MSSSATLNRTPLADWHTANGARMVDFAGWSMPVHYDTGTGGSIVDEHVATRTGVGLFDVSHMGRLTVEGPAAEAWLDGLLTRRVEGTPVGRVRYSLVCNEAGGVLDDILFTRVGEERFDLVVNASNRAKLLDWFATHAMADAELTDRTCATAMIAVQGPKAVALVAGQTGDDVAAIRYYRASQATVAGVPCDLSRTGYTGEDGFELICPAERASDLWEALVAEGAVGCGLASRDTLRLEAGMPLYGHELDEATNPIEAGLAFAVDLKRRDGSLREFIGSDALTEASGKHRVGLRVDGKRAPREGYTVLSNGTPIGVVTSGAPSPTLGYPIAMAYVNDSGPVTAGAPLQVENRGRLTEATVVELPFYKRS
ncbi:Glycine cleavage system T protein [Planctomycetes bacterium MalM25]|nr:Glycine cleavage system T protein [Planctomycetes bacterium MalM25]